MEKNWSINLCRSNKKIQLTSLLNVNIPDLPINKIEGFEVTRLGSRHHAEATIKSTDPRGLPIYWVGPPGSEQDAGPGSDFNAINKNKVSITPLKIDITDYQNLYSINDKLNKFSLD